MIERGPKYSSADALARLESACARAEHCSFELRQKLYRWNITETAADNIIDSLIDRKFVDDERFARAFVNDKVRFDRWGPKKIANALALKRIPSAIVRGVLSERSADEHVTNLVTLLRAKMRSMATPLSSDDKAKLARFAVSRGFTFDHLHQALKQLGNTTLD